MKILSFGEILWDIFGDEKHIGGAPFNFAAHCARLGADVSLCSAVGEDALGREALTELKNQGISAEPVSSVQAETGYCEVTLCDGHPTYHLAENVAYDYIKAPKAQCGFDALYMGTLAMRGAVSREAFFELLENIRAEETVFDPNIRGSVDRELLDRLLSVTTVLKVSDEELGEILSIAGCDAVEKVFTVYDRIKYICVTRGAVGAEVYTKSGERLERGAPRVMPVSTVGAGDSFCAAFTVALLEGRSVRECLNRAVALSSYVVTRVEAVPDYDGFLM